MLKMQSSLAWQVITLYYEQGEHNYSLLQGALINPTVEIEAPNRIHVNIIFLNEKKTERNCFILDIFIFIISNRGGTFNSRVPQSQDFLRQSVGSLQFLLLPEFLAAGKQHNHQKHEHVQHASSNNPRNAIMLQNLNIVPFVVFYEPI